MRVTFSCSTSPHAEPARSNGAIDHRYHELCVLSELQNRQQVASQCICAIADPLAIMQDIELDEHIGNDKFRCWANKMLVSVRWMASIIV